MRESENSRRAATHSSAIQNWRRESAPAAGKKASVRAPTKAPRPIEPTRNPKPWAPTWSTPSANKGTRVRRFIAKSEKTATATSSMPTTGSLRA